MSEQGQWCGQTQPHGPHRWAPNLVGSFTLWRDCAGHSGENPL